MTITHKTTSTLNNFLVLGATGKTGKRIAARLEALGKQVRKGSRNAQPAFDWAQPAGWGDCLQGMDAVYINYAPDLAIPGASDAIRSLVQKAKEQNVKRLVLLSGRGEEEAQACEKIVQQGGIPSTIVRASWFNQNFSEGAFIDMVLSGQITVPVGKVGEPFVDADDIADVALAALTQDGHEGEVYEVTEPRLLTFKDLAEALTRACGREISFMEVPHEAFVEGVRKTGAPEEVVWMIDYLFSTVLDGRNASLTDGIQRALGRKPKDFADYAREVAASGLWDIETVQAAS